MMQPLSIPRCARACALLFIWAFGVAHAQIVPESTNQMEAFKALAKQLASEPPDECTINEGGSPHISSPNVHNVENQLFKSADLVVLRALNTSVADFVAAATKVLKELEEISSQAEASWPQEDRFHYQLLELKTAVVLKQTIRSRSTFSVFGISERLPEKGRNSDAAWRQIDIDRFRSRERHGFDEKLEIYPLMSGPSGKPRFLSKFEESACLGDGSTSIDYTAFEWNPVSIGRLNVILHQKGVRSGEGMFDEAQSPGTSPKHIEVPDIGELETSEKIISLPYCWHSAVDTYVRATLCSVDAYDVSGEDVRFVSRTTNRPDLETIARVIQFAQARELPAIIGYTADAKIAASLIAQIPEYVFSSGVLVTQTGPDREEVQVVDGVILKFGLIKLRGRWLIDSFDN